MKLSRKAKREQRLHRLRSRDAELNIVSMIDVFAVLVFFLLVSSSVAATKLNVISLNLPAPDTQQQPPPEEEQPLALTVVLRKALLEVSSKNGSHTLPNTPAGYDLQSLSNLLVEVKKTAPKEQTITLLMEADIPYDNLVQVMDAARLAPAEARAAGLPREMFPNISIGDARSTEAPTPVAAGASP